MIQVGIGAKEYLGAFRLTVTFPTLLPNDHMAGLRKTSLKQETSVALRPSVGSESACDQVGSERNGRRSKLEIPDGMEESRRRVTRRPGGK